MVRVCQQPCCCREVAQWFVYVSSPAVAERSRSGSCMSAALLLQRGRAMVRVCQQPCCCREVAQWFVYVNSFNTTIREAQLLLQIYHCMQIILFWFVPFLSARLWQTQSFMCSHLAINSTVDGHTCCSHCSSNPSIASCSSTIAIWTYPTCIQRPC